jgi:hypothetical protein
MCNGSSRPAAVPLAGFRTLSAVSWHVVAARPCFVPLPPVGFSLQSFAPRRDRVRLSASLASLQFSTAVSEVRCARPRPPGFTDARAGAREGGAVAWIPTTAPLGTIAFRSSTVVSVFQPLTLSRSERPASRALAHGPSTTSPTIWTSCTGLTPFRRLRLLRSFTPPASPCARRAAFADAPRPVLSWAWPLQSLDPVESRTLVLTRWTVPSTAGLVTAIAKGATPRDQVKSDDLAAATTSSAFRPAGRLRIGPCRLSAAALPPSTLETPV